MERETDLTIEKLQSMGGFTRFGLMFYSDGKMIKMTRADLQRAILRVYEELFKMNDNVNGVLESLWS